MSESGIAPNDPNPPSDSPQPGDAYVSPYLLRSPRTLQQAARDILRRELRNSANVVDLATVRARKEGWLK